MAPKKIVQDNLVALSLQGKGQQKILTALTDIGKDAKARDGIVKLLKTIEKTVKLPKDRSVREELTGPMTDALFKEAGILQKKLKDGTVFNFLYRSKIARDLILSSDEKPDHVFEPQTTKLFVHLAKKTKSVLIAGVYSGDHAVLVAKVMDKKGMIYGFEADKEQISLLKKNAAANKVADKIKAIPVGVWSYDTDLKLVGEDAFAHAVPLKGKAKKDDIVFPAVSIENYTRKNKIDQIDLIQMDIEGSELPALKGAERFLSQPVGQAPNIIFEVHRYYVDWSKGLGNTEIVKYLRKQGYHVYAIRDFQSNVPMPGCKIELIEPEKTYLEGPPHGFNMLAVKDKSILKPSVFRFVKNVSPKLLLHKSPALHWPTEWRK